MGLGDWTSIPIVMGVAEDGEDVVLDLVRDHHVVITGAVRSGKSVSLYTLLGGVKAMNTPVRVCGVDPTGLLMSPYAGGDDLVVAGTADPQRVLDALTGVVDIMHDRLADLRERCLDKYAAVSHDGPLILVVLEGYQTLLDELDIADRPKKTADRIKPRVEALVDTIVAGGAKCQIKVVLSMQRASAKRFDSDTRANFSTRISFRVDDDESLLMLFPGLDRDVIRRVQGFGPGMGLVKTPGSPVRMFRGDYSSYYAFRNLFNNDRKVI